MDRKLSKIPISAYSSPKAGQEAIKNSGFNTYNGLADMPEEWELKLSDSFMEKSPKNSVELTVKVYNVNYKKGARLLAKSETLSEYSFFVQKARGYMLVGQGREEAIGMAVEECIREGILTSFLEKYGREVIKMLFKEITMEEYGDIREADGIEKGMEKGIEKGMEKGIEKGKMETALSFKQAGVEPALIAKCTGLPIDVIKSLN